MYKPCLKPADYYNMSRRVLIVEDDLAFISLIELSLRDMDFDFDISREGTDALKKITQNEYDLIISDFRLPEIHGVDILKLAKKQNASCQTILISAAAEDAIGSDLKNLGILGFMQKPFSPIEFRRLVKEGLEKEIDVVTRPE